MNNILFNSIIYSILICNTGFAQVIDISTDRLEEYKSNTTLQLNLSNLTVDQIPSENFNNNMILTSDTIVNNGNNNKKSIHQKSLNRAITLALVPGFLVHGMGHFYVGRKNTGVLLFFTSVLGICLYVVDFDNSDEYYEAGVINDKFVENTWGEKHKYHDIIYPASRILFFGSWAYDIFVAPIMCSRHNKRLREQVSLRPYIERNHFGYQTGVRLSYRF